MGRVVGRTAVRVVRSGHDDTVCTEVKVEQCRLWFEVSMFDEKTMLVEGN